MFHTLSSNRALSMYRMVLKRQPVICSGNLTTQMACWNSVLFPFYSIRPFSPILKQIIVNTQFRSVIRQFARSKMCAYFCQVRDGLDCLSLNCHLSLVSLLSKEILFLTRLFLLFQDSFKFLRLYHDLTYLGFVSFL